MIDIDKWFLMRLLITKMYELNVDVMLYSKSYITVEYYILVSLNKKELLNKNMLIWLLSYNL